MRGISHFCESSQHFSRKRFFCEVDFFANGDQAGRLFLRKRCDIFANENGCVTAVRNHSFWYPQNSIQLTIVSKSCSIPTKTTICTVFRDRLRRRNQTKRNLLLAFQFVCGPGEGGGGGGEGGEGRKLEPAVEAFAHFQLGFRVACLAALFFYSRYSF